MSRILVIEDDQRIRELVCKHLADEGHAVSSESTGLDGLRSVTAEAPDVVILDLGLPDLDGLDLLKMIRSIAEVPVLVLTAREDEQTVLHAFDEGADDYVVKPVSGPQLSARIAALLRRSSKQKNEVVKIGDLEIHLAPRKVFFENKELELTAKEFDLLAYLADRPGTVVSKEELHAAVWKAPVGTEGRTIDVHISTLRKKLGQKPSDDSRYLHTIIGAGVRLQGPES
jgi:DNA-binding response OmpR family regulator